MAQPAKLSGPVGRSAMNHPKDVVIVQQLLNGHIQRDPCRKPLRVDGKWSQEFERAIATFQKLAGGTVMTEGRMEPGTRMFEMLLQPPAIFGYERRMAQLMRFAQEPASPTIEVFIFDAILTNPGSQWGHAAIDIDGKTYSRAPTKYAVFERSRYLAGNLQDLKRDVVGLVLRVSQYEKNKIKDELDKRVASQKPYNIATNSCSTNVAELLEMVGILAHDPRFQMIPSSSRMVTPKELLIVVSRSNRMLKRNNYKKVS
jgi:hypothetical protein